MPISLGKYLELKERLLASNFAAEVDWAEDLEPVATYERFVEEFCWVILTSTLREQVVLTVWKRLVAAVQQGMPVVMALGHKARSSAIERAMSDEGKEWFEEFQAAPTPREKVEVLGSLPGIGVVTKWALAKALGVDCVKPGNYMTKLAGGVSEARILCNALALQTKDPAVVVDAVLWRASKLGWI